jgi:peptidoglycan hydrolase-like protein with peptidoglycan-binding domain
MNSGATESVTGVPTRYQSSTVTDANYAGGNFAFVEVGSVALAATAHNWTVCQYRNQAGTDAQSFPSLTGNASAIVRRLDHPVGQWFMPLAGSDVGVMDLAQMQCSTTVATGEINFVIGHPLAFMPCPVANMVCITDGLNTAFNLVRIFDDAAMAFLEMPKPATGATTYSGTITAVHG